jgi:hypothetical protein
MGTVLLLSLGKLDTGLYLPQHLHAAPDGVTERSAPCYAGIGASGQMIKAARSVRTTVRRPTLEEEHDATGSDW